MTVSTEVTIDGITFDCGWYADDDGLGTTWIELESVSVGGQDLTGVISYEWWEKIQEKLTEQLEDAKEDMKSQL